MKLVDLTVKDFLVKLGSDEPAPGGGSASAVASSMGSHLTAMVMYFTIGRKKYAEFEDHAKEVAHKMELFNKEFINFVDRDTEAFNEVSAVFSMPKETEEDKAARKEAMQKALKNATKVPFELMIQTLEALKVAETVLGKFNTNAASDLGVAALNFKSGMHGAWLNVLINLSGVSDAEFVKEYTAEGMNIIAKGDALADKIYNDVQLSM